MTIFYERTHRILNGILTQRTFANGYIFHGPLGSFTQIAARAFSKSIQKNITKIESEISQSIQAQPKEDYNTIDFYYHKSDGKITIDHIRSIQEKIKYGPNQHPYLIIVIENSDQFTIAAANAFLKSLEEPPEGVIFILLTHNISGLLPTIRSRCQAIDFPVLSTPQQHKIIESFYTEQRDSLLLLAKQSPTLLSLFLETASQNNTTYFSFTEILSTTPHLFTEIATTLIKEKTVIPYLLLSWTDDIVKSSFSLTQKTYYINAIADTLGTFYYNINMKLQLESLFIKIHAFKKEM